MRSLRRLLVVLMVCLPRAASPQGGTPLGPEFRVNTFTTGSQLAPAVAVDVGGTIVVVWESPQDGSGLGVFAQRYNGFGLPVGPEFRVNTFITGNQFAPAVTSEISGHFVVVWASELQDGSGLGIFGQRYLNVGVPDGPEFRVNSYTTGDQLAPSVVVEKSEIFIVVWESVGQDGSGSGIFGQRYIGFGPALGGEFRINTTTNGDQRSPSVAANQASTFVIVWESDGQDGSSSGVFGQRYSSSGPPQGPEFRANSFTTGNQRAPAASASGNRFAVVWQSQDQDTSGYGIFGQRYNFDGAPLGSEFLVNTFVAGDQSQPAAANDISADFAVVWQSTGQDGNAAGVYGQRYANTGTPVGPEFRVNTYTTGAQNRPAVAARFGGEFVVAWTSDQQDGSQYGVFSQRYGPIVPVELMRFGVE